MHIEIKTFNIPDILNELKASVTFETFGASLSLVGKSKPLRK